MRKLNNKLMELLSSDLTPKISIILPIHPETPQAETNMLAYKNLLKAVKKDLEYNYPRREWNNVVEKLESLILDRKLWNDSQKSLLIFANNQSMEICKIKHSVLPKQHVGNTFLIQDLLLPEEDTDSPDYLINLSRDRINVFDINTQKQVEIAGLHQQFSDYYQDFDSNSNVNTRSYGGLHASYHGHRSKSEEQQKDQGIYYQYLDKELNKLSQQTGYTFILAGLPEVLDIYLKDYKNSKYISGVINKSVLNLTNNEFLDCINDYFNKEKNLDAKRIKEDIAKADRQGRLIQDPSIIDLALNNQGVKSVVSFNDGSSYSIEHNKLLLKSLLNKIYCQVVYIVDGNSYPSINAILY